MPLPLLPGQAAWSVDIMSYYIVLYIILFCFTLYYLTLYYVVFSLVVQKKNNTGEHLLSLVLEYKNIYGYMGCDVAFNSNLTMLNI